MDRRKALISVAALIALAAAGWWWLGRAVEIGVARPYRGTAVEIVYATGVVEPVRWAKVASLIRDRIVMLCDCEGKQVTKGDVLALLDDREAQAQLQELKTREDFFMREMSRVNELVARGATTTQAYERAARDLQQIQALISVQVEKISDYTIKAPMDGVVLRRDGEVGEIAEAGQVLFRVGVLKPLQVVAEVNEEDIPRVMVGQKVLFRTDAFPDSKLEGTVRELTPMGDAVAKTYRIRVDLPDDTPLMPGMSVEANIVTREKPDALLLPADAVLGNAVYVIAGGRARKREVVIGIRGTRAVEIVSGVTANERVASPAPTDLADGVRVRVREAGAAKP